MLDLPLGLELDWPAMAAMAFVGMLDLFRARSAGGRKPLIAEPAALG